MFSHEKLDTEGLLIARNLQVEVGIIRVQAKAVFLAALRLAFLKTSGKSPITLEEGITLKLNGQLKLKRIN